MAYTPPEGMIQHPSGKTVQDAIWDQMNFQSFNQWVPDPEGTSSPEGGHYVSDPGLQANRASPSQLYNYLKSINGLDKFGFYGDMNDPNAPILSFPDQGNSLGEFLMLAGAAGGFGVGAMGSAGAFGTGMADTAWGVNAAAGAGEAVSGFYGPAAGELSGAAASYGAGAGASSGGGFFSDLWSGAKNLFSPVSSMARTAFEPGWAEVAGSQGATDLMAATAGGAGAMPWGTISSGGSILSGILGLNQANQLKKAGASAATMQDPFGSQRPQYQAQLAALMANPSSIVSRPGFDAGRIAVDRSMASMGYNPATSKISGNYLDAQSRYGGEFYDKEVQRLMTLAGANIGPSGGNLALQGQTGSTQLTGQALQSIIAGARGLWG